MLGLCGFVGFSTVAESRGCSLVVVRGLLIEMASLVAEHGLEGTRAQKSWLLSSRAQAQ